MRRLNLGRMALALLVGAAVCATARAAFPEAGRPIKIIVPYSSGGPADKTARDLAAALRKVLETPVVVENVAGASGTVGANKVLQAAPDGYTLLFSHIGMSTAYALYRKSSDTLDDFEYLGVTSELPMILIGRLNLEPSTWPELVRWIKARKGNVTIANAGTGSASHMCGLLIQSQIDVQITAVPYKGTSPAMSDVVGGYVDLLCDQSSTASPQIVAGRVKAIATTRKTRFESPPVMTAIPTMEEAGLKGISLSVWQGLYAPKGTPHIVLQVLNNAMRQALKDPTYIERQRADGATVVTDERMTPEGHRRLVKSETDKWSAIIKSANGFAD